MKKFFVLSMIALFCAANTFAGNGDPKKPAKAYDGVKCSNSKSSSGAGTSMKKTAHAKSASSASRPNFYSQKKSKSKSASIPNYGKKHFKMNTLGYGAGHTVKGPVKKLVFRSSPCGSMKIKSKRLG
jgi:hypothetical protein